MPLPVTCTFYIVIKLITFASTVFQVVEYRHKRYKKALARSPNIKGPGEDGTAVFLTAEEQAEADKLFAKETFNVIASNKVALDRRIIDNRHREYAAVYCIVTSLQIRLLP